VEAAGMGAGASAVEAAMQGAGAEVLAVMGIGDARVGVEAMEMEIGGAEGAAEKEIELSVASS